MPIIVESRRKKLETIQKTYPNASPIIDVTSKGPEPWVRFSPFFPHGGIPIPNSPGKFGQSVEGIWQGLKVFEKEDIDPSKWAIISMKGIKRSGTSRGKVRGHRFGVGSETLLGYRDARQQIYLPAYQWLLQNRLAAEVSDLRALAESGPVVLLDYETNGDIDDLTKPLSHASLIAKWVSGEWKPH